MTNKVALKILEIEKDKLMSEPESNRDWELITALDVVINDNDLENAEIKELKNRIEFLKQQIRLWQSKEQQVGDCEENMDERETPIMDIIKTDEARCSCCGELMKPNEGTIIAGRCRTYILCSDCDKRKDEFIKWSDEED